jgi:hypothetical protein
MHYASRVRSVRDDGQRIQRVQAISTGQGRTPNPLSCPRTAGCRYHLVPRRRSAHKIRPIAVCSCWRSVPVGKNQGVLTDLVLPRTSDSSRTCFMRTDQFDDGMARKLRITVPACQKLHPKRDLLSLDAESTMWFRSSSFCHLELCVPSRSASKRHPRHLPSRRMAFQLSLCRQRWNPSLLKTCCGKPLPRDGERSRVMRRV